MLETRYFFAMRLSCYELEFYRFR